MTENNNTSGHPQIFSDVECTTCPPEECACGDQERVLRRIAEGSYPHSPMTPAQRQWCIDEADSAGEGAYRPEELATYSDADLASATIRAWADYARSNC